jgi:hypothetical protein
MNQSHKVLVAILIAIAAIIAAIAYFGFKSGGWFAPAAQPSGPAAATASPGTSGTAFSATGSLVENNPGLTPGIRVASPQANATVASPLTVTGEARGTWFFEAQFPVRIVDANGNELGSSTAHALGDWMTANFVPFTANITFRDPATATGTLVFEKDNPSGLPQNAAEIRIPIRFNTAMTSVKLFYYETSKDADASGNIQCSQNGLVAVNREIPASNAPIQDAIRELLKGQLTSAEKTQGITTEFPLPGVELKGASLQNGVLTLEFDDPEHKTSGGSCRAGILWNEIQATAKQFPAVTQVKFQPEDLFQP